MEDDLFAGKAPARTKPLAARMRPQQLDDIVGQDHILGKGQLLRRAIEADRLGSIILYGPPGTGKTSTAEVIAAATKRRFERASGVVDKLADLRKILNAAKHRVDMSGEETILFIDEIHRFNKSQQDVLLPYVEEGHITLIGATTHNPFFFINNPLTSRSQIFQLEPLSEGSAEVLLRRAVDDERGLAHLELLVDDDAFKHLAAVCEGDGRRALNALEIAALTTEPSADGAIHVTRAVAEASIQMKAVRYDHDEDEHYDTISAFIKSVRGSDPQAAIYWLAKMLYAGEDPRFIARRLVILASEDIGNADPSALPLAVAGLRAVEFIGMPEARLTLTQVTAYLATAAKSNASTVAIIEATKDIKGGRVQSVPKHLRDKHYKGADELGHVGYQYPHDFPHHFVAQEYMPHDAEYYRPSDQGFEKKIRERMAYWERLRKAGRDEE